MKKTIFLPLVFGIAVVTYGAFYLSQADSQLKAEFQSNESKEHLGESEKPDPDSPNETHLWRSLAWRDNNGQIPGNGILNAVTQRDTYLQQQAGPDGFDNNAIARFNWTSRGPQNVGGRARSIIIHPLYPNIILVGSVSGGVWKSTDRGASWKANNSSLQNFAISSMAIDPNNPDILYAGTGEGFFVFGELQGAGIFKSVDGGMTWNQMPGTESWFAVNRISIARDNSQLILAATRVGLMRTINGGGIWTPVPDYGDKYSMDVAFNPNDSSKAVAQVIMGSQNRVLFSITGGATWNTSQLNGSSFIVGNDFTRIELAYSKSNSNIVYSLHHAPGESDSLSYSGNGGASFVSRNTITDTGNIGAGNYTNTLWVSPTDPNLIVAGGQFFFRSTNGGDNFTWISNADQLRNPELESRPHLDEHCVVNDPGYNDETTNKTVYVCTDGGIFRTGDITTASRFGTGGWEQLNNSFQTTQYYGAAGNGTTGLIYGGTQDNATLQLTPGSQNARLTYGGDGGFAAVDPNDSNYCYGEYTTLLLHRSSNCTDSQNISAQDITSGLEDTNTFANFIAPFILDSNDSTGNRMLAGGGSLWRTNNVKVSGQPTWQRIKQPSSGSTDKRISAIAVAPGHANIIWVAQNDGRVYKTNNGLAATLTPEDWIPVDDNGSTTNPLPPRYVTRILIDKDNSNIVYLSFGGFSEDCLYRTIDGGTNWVDITGPSPVSGGLPIAPIRGIARHPYNSNKLYVGTEIGIYASANGGSSWSPVIEGPANVSIDELTFMSNSTTLLAATHGRGIWTTDVDAYACTRTHPSDDFDGDCRTDVSVFRAAPSPSPPNGTWYVDQSIAGFTAQQWGLRDDKPVAADFDGDGKADICVFRPSNGTWYRINSSNGAFIQTQLGSNGDVPLPADFDGDHKSDEAVFHPATGIWYLNRSQNGPTSFQWGISSDLPTAADFDGDGLADAGIFRLVGGLWYLWDTGNGPQSPIQFGASGDIPTAADYDGDGKTDISVWRASNTTWYAWSASQGITYVPWGLAGDIPVPGDYDGDGKYDFAVWRPTDGNWYLRQSTNGNKVVHFGANGDIPVPQHQ